ncbi:MAG: 6-phosphogluconolactonase [Solirubrobacteraceae bacterium]|nr:6-phosphogluconolactonase [Solirubrobacteraceae bacterium]
MRFTTTADADAAATSCAETLALALREALARRGVAHLALNGGSTPRPVYERLPALLDDWSAVHVWFCDERCVPPDDPEANFRLAKETLIAGAGLGADRVHRMRGELGPAEGARAYGAELAEHLELDDVGMPVLDVAHIGLGPDGHIASLFPNHPALQVSGWPTVGVEDAPKPPPERISLTLACLNAAGRRVLHTVGEGKRDAVRRTLGPPDPGTPASLLERSGLEVVVDVAADPTP